jgi:hypothetical protein
VLWDRQYIRSSTVNAGAFWECSAVPRKVAFRAYCLHRASSQAVVRINGRDVYLGAYDSPESKQKYHELARTALANSIRCYSHPGYNASTALALAA